MKLSGAPAFLFYLSWLWAAARVRLDRRASITGTPDVENEGNTQYKTNITLNDKVFEVLIDTGSSDLYVVGDVPGAKDTGKTGSVTYAIGSTKGPIKTATLGFEGFTIKDQAFIEQAPDSQHTEGDGIIGLGPGSSSNVQDEIDNSSGDAPLDRIFRQNTTTPNYITVLLGRNNDPTDTFAGDFTIGETVDPYGNITSQPKLPVTDSSSGQHWTTLMDKNGIIGPDGQRINTTKRATGNRLNVMFDTGFTFPQVSNNIANNIYGRVPGAKLANVTGIGSPIWTLPCDTELNISFVFSNVVIPVHPLDTVTDAFHGDDDANGNPTCVGAFQPIILKNQGFDIILGMSFLRNAYLLIDFGDFVDGSLSKVGDPFIQLLSITEPVEAHNDFVQCVSVRQRRGLGSKYKIYIIVGSVVAGFIILTLIVAVSYRASSKRRYRRLNEPVPEGLPSYGRPPAQRY
ncbi:acid protease [Epithele typhae]|uniref:acid protease n=1 Tax=Epithele typhae TaxID=378194 RepID=UPI002007B909|nr:acid protease [Epithele typhae]KAH9931102.1 acid protease [Epithele typhae]